MGSTTQAVLLKEYVDAGQVTPEHFVIKEVPMPSADPLQEGDVLVTLEYLSIDPYMRGRMRNAKGYAFGPFQLDQPIAGLGIARVLASKASHLPTSSYITSNDLNALKWQKVQILAKEVADKFQPIDTSLDVPISAYLGPLGMVGATAYCSLEAIGKPKQGETAVVSAASGAVGSIVGQLLKNVYKCKVVGSAGSDEKVKFLKSIGFDEAFNYKTNSTREELGRLCPDGINLYYDNVGGPALDAVLEHMNAHGRVVACGSISQYDKSPEEKYGVKNTDKIVFNQLLIQGFLVGHLLANEELAAAFKRNMPTYVKEGKVTMQEQVFHGLESAGQAFSSMMTGQHTGKTLVKA